MKPIRRFPRAAALLLALLLPLTACARGAEPSPPASEPAVSASGAAQPFVNPLPEADPGSVNEPRLPGGDILEKLNAAYNQNNDVVGWLQVPGTEIDDEVLQGADNNVYLRSDITKGYSWYGCYFADYECVFGDRNTVSQNVIIYGHSMNDDPDSVKFSQLKKYLDPEFAKAHPYIFLGTPEGNLVYKVFSVMYTDDKLGYIHPDLERGQYLKLLSELKSRSQFDYDVDVNPDDKIICLSTCTYIYGSREDQRYVVAGRLLRPGEDLEPTVRLEKNPDVKPPQF